MRYLKTTKNIGDQVTRYQLEADRLERQDKSFDFFKYASRSKMTGMSKRMSYVNNKEVIVLFKSDNIGITRT